MKLDLEDLQRKAEAATPGPWYAHQNEHYWEFGSDEEGQLGDVCASGVKSVPLTKGGAQENAAFIAAANPAVILDLISRLEEAEDQLLDRTDKATAWDVMAEKNERIATLTAQRDEAVEALGPFGSAGFQGMPADYPVQISWTDGVNRGFSHNSVTTDDFRHAQDVVARLKGGE